MLPVGRLWARLTVSLTTALGSNTAGLSVVCSIVRWYRS
jgi:hypothetical protein